MRLGSPVKLIGIQSRTEVNGQNGVLIDMNANGRYSAIYAGEATLENYSKPKFKGWNSNDPGAGVEKKK